MNHIQIITHLTKNAPNHTRITAPFFLIFGLLFSLTGILLTLTCERNINGSVNYPFKINWYLAWSLPLILSFIALIIISLKTKKTPNAPPTNTSLSFLLRSIAPPLIAYIVILTGFLKYFDSRFISFYSSLFIIFYALALFTLKLFLPLSARILATLLLAFGLTSWIIAWNAFGNADNHIDPTHLANFYLILTGLLHIITATGSLLFEKPHPSSPNLKI